MEKHLKMIPFNWISVLENSIFLWQISNIEERERERERGREREGKEREGREGRERCSINWRIRGYLFQSRMILWDHFVFLSNYSIKIKFLFSRKRIFMKNCLLDHNRGKIMIETLLCFYGLSNKIPILQLLFLFSVKWCVISKGIAHEWLPLGEIIKY